MTQVNYQRNNYTLNLSSNPDLHYMHKTFDIGLLNPYRENPCCTFPQHDYRVPGPVKYNRLHLEEAINFRFSHAAREPLYQIRWKGYLRSQDQRIHSDEIDADVKFRISQEADLKPTFQRRRCHRGRPGPSKSSETNSVIQAERDRVRQVIMKTSHCGSTNLLRTDHLHSVWKAKGQVRTRILQ